MTNYMISDNFSFFELTKTNNTKLLEQNRLQANLYLPTIRDLANNLLERVRPPDGMITNSCFRHLALNRVTPSSDLSQHLLAQAWDGRSPSMTPGELFEYILKKIIDEKIPFGQLILERFKRDYGYAEWVHMSLGPGYRSLKKCGQVIRIDGGKRRLIRKISV